MGRRKRSNRASSTGSIGEDVKIESPKEAKTRSGLCRAMSEGSHVKDHAQSANSPVLRSRSKRGSPDFYVPAPKRLSAYARSLENKQFSISHDDDSVLVKAKTAVFPSKKAKKGFQKDMMQIKELDTHKGQSGTKQAAAGAGTSGVNLPKQGPGDSAITNSNRPATRRKSANAGSMASKKAQKEVVEIIELGSNEASEKKCMKHPGQGRGNTGQSTSGNGHLPKATTPSPPDPAYSEHVDMNAAGLLPELVAKMAMAGPNRGGTITKSSRSIHPLRSPDEWLMVLSHPQEIFLRGKAYVRSLQGHVTIHGFLVRPGATFHPFYSPNCSNLLAVSTVQLEAPSGDPRPDANAIRAALANEDRDRVERILSVVNSHSVVLMFKRLECRMCSYVSCIKPFTQLFSGYDDGPTVSPIGTLDLEMVDRLPEMFMKYDDGYKHVVERFCGQVEQGLAPVVVICGGKNVGKSTLTRYLVNSVLNSCDRVAFLECDVGQTEFTLSGCPALCVITKPLLGPPFTHQRNPHRWCFFGGLSPGAQPREYLHCLRYVYDKYARMDRKPPLVVNTMGWTKGLGVALMVETIKLVRPTLVIQLNSARKAKNFPYITTEFLENDSGFRWKNCEVRNDAKKTEHELVILNSPVSAYLDGHEKYRPKDQRNLMTLAYFGQLQPQQGPLKDLAELQPYEVPWSAVGVHICTGRVANSQYMYVLNASIVALCIADKKQMHQENDPTYPKFFERTPICQGVGFGIVRAIDCEKKVFYILTPVPWAELVKVNCLLRGDLELPEQLLLQQRSQGHHPYTGNPSDVIGASSTKKRRHMFRQKRGTNR